MCSSNNISNVICSITLIALCLLLFSTCGHAQLPVTESWLANTYCASSTNQPDKTPDWQSVTDGDCSVCATASGTIYTQASRDEACMLIREYDNGVCGTGTGYGGWKAGLE